MTKSPRTNSDLLQRDTCVDMTRTRDAMVEVIDRLGAAAVPTKEKPGAANRTGRVLE